MTRSIFTWGIALALTSACAQPGTSGDGGSAGNPSQTAVPVSPTGAEQAPNGGAPAPEPGSTAASQPSGAKPETSASSPSGSATGTGTSAAPELAFKPATPEPAAAPELREVTIPSGRTIRVRLTTPLASDTSEVEDRVTGTLEQPIVVSGVTVVPAGAEVTGSVLEANRSGRVKGRASIAFRFERLNVGGESHEIRTARITTEAAANQRDDLKKGAIGAGVGAIVGGIVGGGKGAAIGAGAGGAGTVLATRGDEVELSSGTTVTTTLQQPMTLSVPVAQK
jgi:hypothetical protein